MDGQPDVTSSADGPIPLDRQRQPRTLVITDDENFARDVEVMVPSFERVGHYSDVEQSEWDLLVTTEPYSSHYVGAGTIQPDGHISVISFGATHLGDVAGSRSFGSLSFQTGTKSREYVIPESVPEGLRPLVERDLLPHVRKRVDRHPSIQTYVADASIHPLLVTSCGDVLAAIALRGRGGGGMLLALPGDVVKRAEWVKAGLQLFRRLDPDRFREVPGWEQRREWLTNEERKLVHQLGELERRREELLADLCAQEEELRSNLARVSAEAESGLRRLLTAQGDELEDAVATVFARLGFGVTKMDPEADPANKLEDLRLTDPDDDQWIALVEVKGKSRGASWNDVNATFRFRDLYRDEAGSWPDAVWYVVNQFAGQDPERRDPVLSSQKRELERWAHDQGGLAIDTAQLFQLLVDVEAGVVEPAAARRSLRDAHQRYVYSAETDDPASPVGDDQVSEEAS